ncbi:MAG: HEPN-associated N-terminal domain-containing protein [Prevotella sp.]|nr:HEPN-associated N-terminal domain-containing protein [Prevotella sp.]
MGYFKERMMESDPNDPFSEPDRGNLFNLTHINNKDLQSKLAGYAKVGLCGYDGSQGWVVDMADFVRIVKQVVYTHFKRLDDGNFYLASSFYDNNDEVIPGYCKLGQYIVPNSMLYYANTEKMLVGIDALTDDDKLNADIKSYFPENVWIQESDVSMTQQQELQFSWSNFSTMVKSKRRFTFFVDPNFDNPSTSENGLNDILSELSDIVKKSGCVKTIKSGRTIYRSRQLKRKTDGTNFRFKDLTSPPNLLAGENRMNPAGISMFYGADSEILSMLETSNNHDGKGCFAIGEFETIKDLVIVDLTNLQPASIWSCEKDDFNRRNFLYDFSKEISLPLGDRSASIEYVPTQIFAEYLRYVFKTDNSNKLDGVMYKSSLSNGNDIVLFYDNETSSKVLKLNNKNVIIK